MITNKILKLLVIILATSIISCNNNHNDLQHQKIKYVKTEKISNYQKGDRLVFNGTVKEKKLTTLSFRVGGPLTSLNVKQGDYVKKGQIIASIDKRDYQLQVESTRLQYIQLKGEHSRYKELFEDDKIPANSYEKIESGYLMAKTAFENAKNQLQDTDLTSPYAGFVFEKMVENFQTVSPGMSIISLIDVSKLEVEISIPENQLTQIKNSSTNTLTVKNADVSNLPVKILSINEKTGKDGLYNMKFDFDNYPSLSVSPGMSAEITMICNNHDFVIQIPSSAVFRDNNNNCVWIYTTSNNSLSKRNISIGSFTNQGRIEVISGLKPNEVIVTAGVNNLFDGQNVQPIQKPSQTNVGGLL
jgi:membrane fusion protein, multidrug efflux system